MGAKAKVVVKLISPREACEGCEVHGTKNKPDLFVRARDVERI
jgi:hypothetical protein